jgi:large subunit ribosomal protein L15
MLTLHNLKKFNKSKKKRKRVGRGDASGHGTYSTRGIKGQRSRSGGKKGLKRKGLKNTLQSIPKNKGFKRIKPALEIINLKDLEKMFPNNSQCLLRDYKEKGLVKNNARRVKILGQGKISKKLKVTADEFSKTAKEAIIKAGGQAIFKEKGKCLKK